MTYSEDTVILASMRVADLAIEIPGSTTDTCEQCGERVAIAPSSRRILREAREKLLPTAICCVPCAARLHRDDPAPQVRPLTREQLDEIATARRVK